MALFPASSGGSDSGWKTNGTLSYRKIGDIVTVYTGVPSAAANAWTTIGTLPSGYRPKVLLTLKAYDTETYRFNTDGTVQYVSNTQYNYGTVLTFIV